MPAAMKIILATVNARYSHTSFGLRYLKANLREFEDACEIREYSRDDNLNDIAEELINLKPNLLGFGCYIWNIESIIRIAEIVRAVSPQTVIVFGGPEVSYQYDEFLPRCDYLISGEGELALYHLAQKLSRGEKPQTQVLNEPICDLTQLKLPYYLYSDEDIQNRLIYVEATRGCPFSCEFCLSSLSKGVREFDLDKFLAEMEILIRRGVRQFKFVDRTFNLKFANVKKILDFFKNRWQDGMLLHFEIFPDRLSPQMLEEIKNFPDKGLHLEAGVQSFDPDSLDAISRKQNEERTLEVLRFIREETGAVIHADLVAGIPHSTLETFAADFDKLLAVRPQELQVGILKKLRGAPIARHDTDFQMIYSQYPPYEIMQNKDMSYGDLQLIKRVARYFDVFYNSENFPHTAPLIEKTAASAFAAWVAFSEFLWREYQQTYKISIARQTRMLFDYLGRFIDKAELAQALDADYRLKIGRKDNIDYIRELLK